MTENDLILAVETSSRIGSVALTRGNELLAEKMFSSPLKHSAEIFPAIFELLSQYRYKPDQIQQIHISGGPGSFTGLRISVTLAKTMHLATGVKIVSVDTLDVIAANVIDLTEGYGSDEVSRAADCKIIATIVDAKRGQFFVAVYERNNSMRKQPVDRCEWIKIVPDCLMRPDQFIERFGGGHEDIWLLGDGLLYYKDKFKATGVCFFEQKYWSPKASNVHLLGRQKAVKGEFSDPLTLTPNYLRGPDVTIKTT